MEQEAAEAEADLEALVRFLSQTVKMHEELRVEVEVEAVLEVLEVLVEQAVRVELGNLA